MRRTPHLFSNLLWTCLALALVAARLLQCEVEVLAHRPAVEEEAPVALRVVELEQLIRYWRNRGEDSVLSADQRTQFYSAPKYCEK
jgi:hypothetical protein